MTKKTKVKRVKDPKEKMRKGYEKFYTDWKTQGVKDRCVKLVEDLTDETSKQQNEYLAKYYAGISFINNVLYSHLLNPNPPTAIISKGKRKGENATIELDTSNAKIPANSFVQIYKNELTALGFISSNLKECVVISALNRYVSYFNRNKRLPKRPLGFNTSKGTYIHKLKWNPKTNELRIPMIGQAKTYLVIPCHTIYNQKYPVDKEFSGNLLQTTQGYTFVARTKLPIVWQYVPVSPLAIDINKERANFLTLSDGTKTPRNPELQRLCELLTTLNGRLRKSNKQGNKINLDIRSKQRRKIRRAWFNTHRHIKRQICKIIKPILDNAIANKLLLCIDPSNTGGKNGNYGQMQFISMLIKECEDKGIPFVIVPTPFTTQRCCECGIQNMDIQKTRRKVPHMQCICGNDIDVDINSAKNIAYFGQMIWNHGFKYFETWMESQNFISRSKVPC